MSVVSGFSFTDLVPSCIFKTGFKGEAKSNATVTKVGVFGKSFPRRLCQRSEDKCAVRLQTKELARESPQERPFLVYLFTTSVQSTPTPVTVLMTGNCKSALYEGDLLWFSFHGNRKLLSVPYVLFSLEATHCLMLGEHFLLL